MVVILDEVPERPASAASRGDVPDLGNEESAEAARAKGNAAFKDGDMATAASMYTDALARVHAPSEMAAQILGNRSAAYVALGRNKDARNDATRCVELSPEGSSYAAKARFRLGNAHHACGDHMEAQSAYRDALEHAPRDKAILKKLAEVSRELGKKIREENEAAARAPPRPPPQKATIQLGNAALKEGRFEDALAIYDAAPPPSEERKNRYLTNRSHALYELGRYDEAVDAARECTSLDPDYVKGWFWLGKALEAVAIDSKNLEAARRAYNAFAQCLRRDPENVHLKEAAERTREFRDTCETLLAAAAAAAAGKTPPRDDAKKAWKVEVIGEEEDAKKKKKKKEDAVKNEAKDETIAETAAAAKAKADADKAVVKAKAEADKAAAKAEAEAEKAAAKAKAEAEKAAAAKAKAEAEKAAAEKAMAEAVKAAAEKAEAIQIALRIAEEKGGPGPGPPPRRKRKRKRTRRRKPPTRRTRNRNRTRRRSRTRPRRRRRKPRTRRNARRRNARRR
jgi:tetratricopeptide (TPR) repeat protein